MKKYFKIIAFVLLALGTPISNASAENIIDDTGKSIKPMQGDVKVITLGWMTTEMIIALGINPIGVSDISGYNQWVKLEPIKKNTQDVGLRNSINLEKINELKPDLIVLGSGQEKYIPKLQKIAPVFLLNTFKDGINAYKEMESGFVRLATVLGKKKTAIDVLKSTKQILGHNAKKIKDIKSPVIFVRFLKGSRVRLHGENSMAGNVMRLMGLKNAYTGVTNNWGFALYDIPKMATLHKASRLIYINDMWNGFKEAEKNAIWKFLPFVINNKVYPTVDTWTYGGPLSAQKISNEIANALQK